MRNMNWYTQVQINQMLKEAQNSPEWSKIISTYGVGAILALSNLWGLNPLAVQNAYAKEPQKVVQELEKVNKKPQEKNTNQVFKAKTEDISSMVARHEGKSYVAYSLRGIMHVGIGCNLEREFMPNRLAKLGLDYNQVLNKKQKLTEQQVQTLFKWDLEDAKNDVRTLVSNFDEQPQIVQNVLIDMAFNMGAKGKKRGLGSMGNVINAVINKDYNSAADHMEKTRWHSQVPSRADELINLMRQVK